MKLKRSSAAIGIAALTVSLLVSIPVVSVPARAADSDISVSDGVCDLNTAGFGSGSVTDPFTIATATALAEINDCSSGPNRSKAISDAVGNGTTVTFAVATAGGAYGVGQAVKISGVTPAGFNNSNARVISSTATSVTVMSSEVGTYVEGGTIESIHDFYKITANISLATGTTEWNDTRSAAITAVSGDGTTVTYTAANTFAIGDTVVVKGVANNDYNLGTVTIASATASEFTVTNSTNVAASSGGTASAEGWSFFNVSNIDLDGQNFTISGLTVDNSTDRVGLFGSVTDSNFSNLKFTQASIDQTDRNRNANFAGVLAGRMQASTTNNIEVSGEVISGYRYAGLLAGYSEYGNHANITTSGSVSAGRILVTSNVGSRPEYYGGVLGYTEQESNVAFNSSANVSAFVTSADGINTIYGVSAGGLIGYSEYSQMRDSSASGDVTGGSDIGGAIGSDGCCSDTTDSSASGSVSAFSNNYYISNVGGFYGYEGCCSGRDNLSASGDVYVESMPFTGGNITSVGGLMGYYGCCGSISNSRATGDVTIVQNNETSSRYVHKIGGFIGYWDCCGEISDSYATGDVTITSKNGVVYQVGGFIGYRNDEGTLRRTYATGNVSVTTALGNKAYDLGGLVGRDDGYASAIGSYATGDVTANNAYNVGGFTGFLTGDNMSYVDSYATGSVATSYDGEAYAGGFIGQSSQRMELTRVFASGNVTASPLTPGGTASAVGGLIGGTTGSGQNIQFTDSYFKGTVTGSTDVGGLIGLQSGDMTYNAMRTYVAATVVATGVGGISDPVSKGSWIAGSQTNFVDSTLAGTGINDPGFIAQTTAEMKTQATFTNAGWTLTGEGFPWRMAAGVNGGYPYLVPVVTSEVVPVPPAVVPPAVVPPAVVPPAVVPPAAVAPVATFSKIKSVSFTTGDSQLTLTQKRQLTAAAKTIAANGSTRVVVRLHSTPGDTRSTSLLGQNASTYLAARLNKLGVKPAIRIELRYKSKKTDTALLRILTK